MVYKYKPVDNIAYVCDILKNNRLYLPKVDELNDPLEGINDLNFGACGNSYSVMEGRCDEVWPAYKDALNKFGIVSLTQRNDNILMWSHYANNFSGICIGFAEDKTFEKALKVKYSSKRYQVDPNISLEKNAIKSLLFKNIDWKYEQEKRIVLERSNQYLCFEENEIKEIIFGPKIDSFYEEIIEMTIEKYNPAIEVKKAHINVYEYKMNIK